MRDLLATGPFEMGWIAAEMGKAITECPLHKLDGQSIAWRNGWKAAWASERTWRRTTKAKTMRAYRAGYSVIKTAQMVLATDEELEAI